MKKEDISITKSERYFDEVYEKESIISEPVKCYPIVTRRLEELEGTLLDVGCGNGAMLSYLSHNLFDQFSLYGIDLSSKAVKIAKNELGNKAEVCKGNVEELPFKDETFDVVICMHSFHHYPHPMKALSEMRRVLNNHGHLLIVENHRNHVMRFLKNCYYTLANHPHGDIKVYSKEELSNLVKRAGFSLVKTDVITKKSFLVEADK